MGSVPKVGPAVDNLLAPPGPFSSIHHYTLGQLVRPKEEAERAPTYLARQNQRLESYSCCDKVICLRETHVRAYRHTFLSAKNISPHWSEGI